MILTRIDVPVTRMFMNHGDPTKGYFQWEQARFCTRLTAIPIKMVIRWEGQICQKLPSRTPKLLKSDKKHAIIYATTSRNIPVTRDASLDEVLHLIMPSQLGGASSHTLKNITKVTFVPLYTKIKIFGMYTS